MFKVAYRKLAQGRTDFGEAYRCWRETVAPEDLGLPEGALDNFRDRSPGCRVDL